MTTPRKTPTYPLLHLRGRSTLHVVALVVLSIALGVKVLAGPSTHGSFMPSVAADRSA